MRLPFRSSRPDVDADVDVDEDDFSGDEPVAPPLASEGPTGEPTETGETPVVRTKQPETMELTYRPPNYENLSADHFADEMERFREEASREQRSAWAYLGVLGLLFVFLVVFGYGCSDLRGDEDGPTTGAEVAVGGEPSNIVFRVDGDIISISGTVPDEAAKAQLLDAAQQRYGAENVIDEIEVSTAATLEGGTIRSVGTAEIGDERAQELQQAVTADFSLTERGFEVGFAEAVLAPVNATVEVDDNIVVVAGTLPDEQSIGDLVAIALEVWGDGNVEGTNLTTGETTWTEGRIVVSGNALSNDQRIGTFVSLVAERIGPLVEVDTSGLAVTDITAELDRVQGEIDVLVATSPILFEPELAEIDPTSEATLVQIAQLLTELPSVPFEVVGHTDSLGNDDENLVLSQDRAAAVVDRLADLGLPRERMSSRGEGESQPIADNTTDDGRAANRRIEFVLVGATDG